MRSTTAWASSEREVEALGLGLGEHGGAAGQLGDHDPGGVADLLGVEVLVGIRAAGQRRGVEPGLVGERRRADVGEVGVEGEVDDLGEVVRDRGEAGEALRRDGLVAHLERQVGDHASTGRRCRCVRRSR